MGIYDRDYNRDEGDFFGSSGGGFGGGSGWHSDQFTMATKIVLAMFLVHGIQLITREAQDAGPFTRLFSLHGDMLRRPWTLFQTLTYGFLHDPFDLKHICFNMLGLWMFGRSVEMRIGRRELLYFLCSAVIFSGIVWFIAEMATNQGMSRQILMGASGGVAAVLILFAIYFPHQRVLIYGILPMPAWIFAIVFVAMDLVGAVDRTGNVAYTAHLGGAFFAFLYWRYGWRMERFLPSLSSLSNLRQKPKLRLHEPEEGEMETQLDVILKKIQADGQESLTRKERRILEQASREFQQRRK